jgi:nucleoside-diphosphate-sugar epimerase
MKVAVTGANGFLGARVVAALQARAHQPVFLTRRPPVDAAVVHVPFDLAGATPSAAVFASEGIAALVHCAWDFRPRSTADIVGVNVEGARRLLGAATEGAVRAMVNISTMSAFAGCRSRYGRAKLALERDFTVANGVNLRPGLLWAERPGGMVGLLDRLVERLPVVPLIGSGRTPLYLTHVDDLADLVLRCLESPGAIAGQTITAAWPQPVPLRDILRQRARARGRSPVLLPVPWPLVWAAVKCAELSPVDLGLRSDSVIGFVYADPAPRFEAPTLAGFRAYSVPNKAVS